MVSGRGVFDHLHVLHVKAHPGQGGREAVEHKTGLDAASVQ
jgi:hypothetical protein